jgi:hypothetical protein
MKKTKRTVIQFAVCVANDGYEASLEVGKLYRIIPDREAERHGYLRVVDESGEDYGYAANRFVLMEVPKMVEDALLKAAS